MKEKRPYIIFTRFFNDALDADQDFLLFEIYAKDEGPGKGFPLMQGFGNRDAVWKMVDSFTACAGITRESLVRGIVLESVLEYTRNHNPKTMPMECKFKDVAIWENDKEADV